MRPLNRAPGIVLARAEFRLLGWMPPNRGGIKKYMRALQRSETSALGIPLIPTDQRAYAANIGVESSETEIAGREIEFSRRRSFRFAA